MKIFSEDKKSFIEIIYKECELVMHPSFSVSVNIHDNESSITLTGQLQTVWFTMDDFKHFLLDFDEMDMKRSGQACLESMSPEEFVLRFEVYDSSGHTKADYSMFKWLYSNKQNSRKYSLSGGFDIDPSDIPNISRDFHSLVPKA